MSSQITSIKLPLPFRMGTVNCYLIATEEGYVLIDTGGPKNRKQVEAEMLRAGCEPGFLKLILITHGDFDHTGNAVYLRELDRKSTRLNSSHSQQSRMPSSA